jgi:hypothetical protein
VGVGGLLSLPLGALLAVWLDRILKRMPGEPTGELDQTTGVCCRCETDASSGSPGAAETFAQKGEK